MSSSDKAPEGWDPEVFARIRAESDAEQAARSPEEREELAKYKWDYLDSLDDSDNYAPDSLRDKMRDVPGFDDNMNPFPLTREPEDGL
ncbi:hypothetical protein [Nocardia macrotermitis]|uniref:Uncharacterized protein n=1 Tax=Nocardia macrotermitis TaxID=2585198 RepID=A0A7K0DFF7_9NOCA|nr:hypothetical protein [Nocardia macrotermitis]MQY24437.1 hypothetical protein [Nocardia macrotermitis]